MKNKLPPNHRRELDALLTRAGFFPELVGPILDLYELAREGTDTTAEIAAGPGSVMIEIVTIDSE